MENITNKASSMADMGNLQNLIGDLKFPASKDQILSQLQQKGAPSQVTDKLKNLDVSQFTSADDLKSKLGGLGM
jgi:uncharacterized protein DUF2795